MTDGDLGGRLRRRTLLSGAVAALAGCAGLGDGDPDETDGSDSTPPPTQTTATTDGSQSKTGSPTATATASPTAAPVFPGYETTPVRARTSDGETLGRVTAAVADTFDLRYTGLSDTPSMPEDYGMLFVFEDVSERTFVMRRMDFPLDMLFADDAGRITVVHSAPAPGPDQDGENIRREGRGKYVLEVNRGWAADRGVTAGDVLAFELP